MIGRVRGVVERPIRARQVRSLQAQVLRKATQCVEIARLPLEQQYQSFDQVKVAHPKSGSGPAKNFWYFTAPIDDHCHFQALLRCAITGLALERYRNETGRWPERLDELAPGYLKSVPLNPFDGQPLHYKRLANGVVAYALAPDDRSEFGMFWMPVRGGPDAAISFRLWDADQRRQPAAELLPMPKPEKEN
jgi:hypothetical protein